ncbi:hypothetical protein GCM10009758_24670 [Microbacterium hatanonis]
MLREILNGHLLETAGGEHVDRRLSELKAEGVSRALADRHIRSLQTATVSTK